MCYRDGRKGLARAVPAVVARRHAVFTLCGPGGQQWTVGPGGHFCFVQVSLEQCLAWLGSVGSF
eukprot:4907663-Alexandrium_andersonii.AAC.1